jgi:hypothetical protein
MRDFEKGNPKLSVTLIAVHEPAHFSIKQTASLRPLSMESFSTITHSKRWERGCILRLASAKLAFLNRFLHVKREHFHSVSNNHTTKCSSPARIR